jgi:hypothetical protein
VTSWTSGMNDGKWEVAPVGVDLVDRATTSK